MISFLLREKSSKWKIYFTLENKAEKSNVTY